MKKGLFLALILLAVLEGIAWFVHTNSKKNDVKFEEVALQENQSKQSVPSESNATTVKEFDMVGRQYTWEPSVIKVKQGEGVRLRIKSEDVLHGIVIPELGVDNIDIPAGETKIVEFTADKKGRFEFLCSTFCGDRHIDMTGVIIVE